MLTVPRRRHAFALQPADRTAASPGLVKIGDFNPIRRPGQSSWQDDAFSYYESLPPVGYVMDYKASVVAACDFAVLVDGPDGQVPVEDDETIDRLMASLVGPRGGIAELRRRAALLLEISGEAYFTGSPVEDESEAVWWEFLSIDEILPPDGGVGGSYRRDFGGGEKIELPEDTYIARVWRSDARHSALAHCGLRRCLDTCRELMLLSRMTEAIIASRLPMGLLLIPDTVDWNPTTARTDETAGSDIDVAEESDFLDDLITHLSAPITDFGSASTLVPLVIRAHKDDLASIKIVDLARDLDQYAASLRDEMYARLAIGLDVPAEILEGKGGMNHWGSWNVDNDFLWKHVVPLGNLVADFLTHSYLRPMLIESEGMDIAAAADYTITFDASPLANNEDDHQKARDLWDELLVSDRTVVEKQGWDPDSVMPDEEERRRRLLEKLVFTKVVTLSDEGAKFLGLDPKWLAAPPAAAPPGQPGQPGDADADADEVDDQQQQGVPPTRPEQGDQADADPDAVEKPPAKTTAASRAEAERLVIVQLATRADADFDRALERAGSRILTAAQRVPTFRGRFSAHRPADIPSMLTPDDLATLKVSAALLLDGSWDTFTVLARDWLGDYFVKLGASGARAERTAGEATAALVAALGRWGAANFHGARVRNRATGLRAPVEMIANVVTQAAAVPARVAV